MKALAQKIVKVMKELRAVPKTGYNQQQGYEYIESDVLLQMVGDAMAKHGLAIIPEIGHVEHEMLEGDRRPIFVTKVTINFTVVDADSGESTTITWHGFALDTFDKGLYKAITGAHKYMLLKLFAIGAGGEDPEQQDVPIPQNARKVQPKPQPRPQEQPRSNGGRLIIKTPNWKTVAEQIAATTGYFLDDKGNPNFYHIANTAKKLGFTTISDENLNDVAAALIDYANQKMAEEAAENPPFE